MAPPLQTRSSPNVKSPSRASSTRRARWCSRPGPMPRCWRNGGARRASPIRSARSTRASAAPFASTCARPDGTVYPMKGEIREIVPPERLVFTNIAVDADGQSHHRRVYHRHLRRRGRQNDADSAYPRLRGRRKCRRLSAGHGDRLDHEHRQARGTEWPWTK